MRVLLLTSTRLRHFALAARLAEGHTVGVLAETPRQAPSGGGAMADYFRRMDAAEAAVFGRPWAKVWLEVRPFGADLTRPGDVTGYDRVVVFGASWIREPTLSLLTAQGAINLHAGVSPYYRGAACNFWAAYDGRPHHVGYTVHQLTAGLDAGPILRVGVAPGHADAFVRGMLACQAGFQAVVDELAQPSRPVAQDRALELRYSRAADFTEAVCAEYLERIGRSEA